MRRISPTVDETSATADKQPLCPSEGVTIGDLEGRPAILLVPLPSNTNRLGSILLRRSPKTLSEQVFDHVCLVGRTAGRSCLQ